MRFVSDFAAFDPDAKFNYDHEGVEEGSDGTRTYVITESESCVPLGDTVPLLVLLNTTGEWEVIGETPETSTNASGFNLARLGFRPGQVFTCKIFIRREHFEVSLLFILQQIDRLKYKV